MRIDLVDIARNVQERLSFVTTPDKLARELIDILRDTHRILRKLEAIVDRVDDASREWEERLRRLDLSPDRLQRLERAVFNIERATLGVEASMGALPRALRTRIDRRRLPGAGEQAAPVWSPPQER